MKEKRFTARELMDKLKELNERLYEEVLDTISDHYNPIESHGGYFAWDETEDGDMIMYLEGEEE
jgi:uncharacterized protein (DUF2249 family)|tara:strand:- start:253 stop:444 length:192 start_codon:yes stop_codon:yes gene_type:complete